MYNDGGFLPDNWVGGMAGAKPAVNTSRPSLVGYKDRIMRFYCLDWRSLILLVRFVLLGLACRVVVMGSIYLLCPTCRLRRLTVWGLIFLFFFLHTTTIAFVLTFLSGFFYFPLIFHSIYQVLYPFWVVSL